jgi:hypothetical protein
VSRDIRATPPKSHRVISEIWIPLRTATTAWPSSCSRIEAKNESALTTARTYGSLPSPTTESKYPESQMITRNRTRNQE